MQNDNTKHIVISVACVAPIRTRLSDVMIISLSFKESKLHNAGSILQKKKLVTRKRKV